MPIEALAVTRAGLEPSWNELGAAGTWWTGAERIAMAREARAARSCVLCVERRAALSPEAVPRGHAAEAPLVAEVVDAVHRLASDPGRLTRRWFQKLVDSGLEPEAVVEIIGVVSILSIADTLDVGLGQPQRPLPDTAPGEPSRTRPAGLEVSCAWAPTVAIDRAEGVVALTYDVAKSQAGFVFHVARALTSVPGVYGQFLRAFSANYQIAGETAGVLSRPQVELLAASTSSINECFY